MADHRQEDTSGARRRWLVHLSDVGAFTNKTYLPATVESIEVVDPADNYRPTGSNRVVSMDGGDIAAKVSLFAVQQTFDSSDYSTEVAPGQSGSVYFDVTYRDWTSVPARVAHRVSVYLTTPGGEKKHYDGVTDDGVAVSKRKAIVLGPALRGPGWVDANGCCRQIGLHRGFLSPIDGALWTPEVFAIDFVQINAKGVGLIGDPQKLKSYIYYGADVFAAAAGVVTDVVSDLPDQAPNNGDPVSLDTAAGNHVIVDMGEGRYALYAHLKPNSPSVHVGDCVYRGQRLGLLGNSGNTTAPHLHFQVMDHPSPLKAEGLPFMIDEMRLAGEFRGSMQELEEKFFTGTPLLFDLSHNGRLREAMPLGLDVFDFE